MPSRKLAMINIKKICQTALVLKIISFFYENPTTVETSSNIAAWLNSDCKKVKKTLDYLVGINILVAHYIDSTIAYAYTQDKDILKEIKKFLKNKRRKDV